MGNISRTIFYNTAEVAAVEIIEKLPALRELAPIKTTDTKALTMKEAEKLAKAANPEVKMVVITKLDSITEVREESLDDFIKHSKVITRPASQS